MPVISAPVAPDLLYYQVHEKYWRGGGTVVGRRTRRSRVNRR